MRNKKSKQLSLSTQKSIAGLLFSLPFVIGFLFFFLTPLVRSIVYSFGRITVEEGLKIDFIGFGNYENLLLKSADFVRNVANSIWEMFVSVPSVILFSFFIAVILNQRFKGRTVARAIFFLPVIIASGVFFITQDDSVLAVTKSSISGTGNTEDTLKLTKVIIENFKTIKLDPSILGFVTDSVNKVYNMAIASGVQILIFLAGLQTISPSLYEASSIEGATAWENFWKITFPMVSPIILVNCVYTIIDQLSGLSNPIINWIYTLAFKGQDFGLSAAGSWIYFAIIFILIGGAIGIISKKVFYEND